MKQEVSLTGRFWSETLSRQDMQVSKATGASLATPAGPASKFYSADLGRVGCETGEDQALFMQILDLVGCVQVLKGHESILGCFSWACIVSWSVAGHAAPCLDRRQAESDARL